MVLVFKPLVLDGGVMVEGRLFLPGLDRGSLAEAQTVVMGVGGWAGHRGEKCGGAARRGSTPDLLPIAESRIKKNPTCLPGEALPAGRSWGSECCFCSERMWLSTSLRRGCLRRWSSWPWSRKGIAKDGNARRRRWIYPMRNCVNAMRSWRVDTVLGVRPAAHTQIKLQYSIEHRDNAAREYGHVLAAQFTVRF